MLPPNTPSPHNHHGTLHPSIPPNQKAPLSKGAGAERLRDCTPILPIPPPQAVPLHTPPIRWRGCACFFLKGREKTSFLLAFPGRSSRFSPQEKNTDRRTDNWGGGGWMMVGDGWESGEVGGICIQIDLHTSAGASPRPTLDRRFSEVSHLHTSLCFSTQVSLGSCA